MYVCVCVSVSVCVCVCVCVYTQTHIIHTYIDIYIYRRVRGLSRLIALVGFVSRLSSLVGFVSSVSSVRYIYIYIYIYIYTYIHTYLLLRGSEYLVLQCHEPYFDLKPLPLGNESAAYACMYVCVCECVCM